VVALALIGLHDLTDSVRPDAFGAFAWLWRVLHVPDFLDTSIDPVAKTLIRIDYPLVPWIGVMALGYSIGPILQQPLARPRRNLVILGLLAMAAFLVFRFANGYGDPQPWSVQPSRVHSVFAFLRVRKYPPSLDYLLITLGPALIALAYLERVRG